MTLSASSNCPGFERWVMSPVWIMKAGLTGSPFTLAIASFKAPGASGLAGLLKPMLLLQICRKLKPVAAFSVACAVPMPRSCDDLGTPPLTVQMTPVPAQIMHSSAPRRSIPVPCLLSDMFGLHGLGLWPVAMKETSRRAYLFPVPCEFFAAIAVSPWCVAVVRAIDEKA